MSVANDVEAVEQVLPIHEAQLRMSSRKIGSSATIVLMSSLRVIESKEPHQEKFDAYLSTKVADELKDLTLTRGLPHE